MVDGTILTVRKAVVIDRAIIHRVYDEAGRHVRRDEPPLLSDDLTPLNADAEAFLSDHITNSQADYRARRGTFNQPEQNCVLAACDAVFADPASESVFIEQSRAIAWQLFEAMSGPKHMDARISTGDLLVCLVDAESSDGQRSSMLALLKIDPRDGFAVEPDPTGRRLVLRQVSNILTDTRLQKCAFILPPAERKRAGHDLIVLDLQTNRRSASGWAASYFVGEFLDCSVGLTPADQLRIFLQWSTEWINRQSWPDGQKQHVRQQVIEATHAIEVDLEAFARQIITDDDQREDYLNHLRAKGLRELVLRPDPSRQSSLVEYTTFEGDNGLRLRIKWDDYYGPDKRVDVTKDEADGYSTICIRTKDWNEAWPLTGRR